VSFSRASFSSHFIVHSYFTFFLPAFISRSKSSLWTPNYQAYQGLFNFDGGGNRSARRKPPVRDLRRKSLFYMVQLVPRAGIEPTPRTDICYRPVSQTRQTRREPLGHHVPHWVCLSSRKVLDCCFVVLWNVYQVIYNCKQNHIPVVALSIAAFTCMENLPWLLCILFRWVGIWSWWC
jgi:hypothetical protein